MVGRGLVVVVVAATSGCTASAVSGAGGLGGTEASQSSGAGPTGAQTTGNVTQGSGASTPASSGSSSTQPTSTVSGSSSSSIPCVPVDCADAEPCTIDACDVDGTCSHTQRQPGELGDITEGACEGVCQTDGHCGLSIYHRDLSNPVWTRSAISQIWSGANAPPTRGILAAESGTTFEVMVLADDGMVYRRIGGAWIAPVVGSTIWGGVDTTQARTLYGFGDASQDSMILWFAGPGGNMRSIVATVTGNVQDVSSGPNDCSASGSFPCNLSLDWGTMTGPGLQGGQWFRFGDGNVYRWEGLGFTGSGPETSSDAWGDPATAPAAGTVAAALVMNHAEIQLVAP